MLGKLLLSCGLLVATCGLGPAETEIGKAAPSFTLPDTNGKEWSLANFKGKYVVLEWYNPDCPFVGKHYRSGNMQGLQKEFTSKGVVWLSIDSSAPATVRLVRRYCWTRRARLAGFTVRKQPRTCTSSIRTDFLFTKGLSTTSAARI